MNDAQKRHVSVVTKTGHMTCASVSRVLKSLSGAETLRLTKSLLPSTQHTAISAGSEHSLKVWAFGPAHFIVESRFYRAKRISGFNWKVVQYTQISVRREDFRQKCIWTKLPALRIECRMKKFVAAKWELIPYRFNRIRVWG